MSPTERLIAAAEKVEQQFADLPERHQDAWSERLGYAGWTDIVSEAWDQDGNGHRSFVCQVQEYPSARAIVTAVSAMPGLAFWLREMASEVDNLGTGDGHEAHGQDPWTDLCTAALAVADQILGGQR